MTLQEKANRSSIDGFIAQTAEDYDLDFEIVATAYNVTATHKDFYSELESILKQRANS
jgi:hypothetical protein